MASAAKSASAFITLLTKRGYAAAAASSQGVVSSGGTSRIRTPVHLLLKKEAPKESVNSSWGPDPVTGYYRPENHTKEIDAAELRRVLLSKNMREN